MSKLRISDDLTLPLEFVTSTQAILAKRRVGKSYTASVQAEEMLKAKQQVVVVDPTGAWWGLKSSADGKSAGFPIAVLGGEHADVPLEETAGEMIAGAIVADRFSAVLDLSLFRKGQLNRFMASFLETLYRLNREAVHLFIDEADAISPQKPFGEEARTLGAVQDVVRRGGIKGIGCTLITQRSAVLNKDVLTQCEVLTTLRLVHPRDIDAIEEWVNVHADPVQAKEMIASLPSLPVGTAWVWSPAIDLFKRVKIRQRETFDSGATPKAGQTIKPPKVLASIDVQKLGKAIAETAERAKENDPKELKRKVAELQRQLAAKAAPTPAEVKTIEKPVVTDKQVKAVESIVSRLEKEGQRRLDAAEVLRASGQQLIETGKEFAAALRSGSEKKAHAPITTKPLVSRTLPVRTARDSITPAQNVAGRDELAGPERKIIDAIAWLNSIGVPEPEQAAVAFVAGYTIGGGAFNNPRGALRSKGLVDYVPGDRIRLTDAGAALAQQPVEEVSNESLQRKVLEKLPGPERKILTPLLEVFPKTMSNEDLAAAAGYSEGGGAYNNPRGRLRTLGLIEYRDGGVAARSILFPEGVPEKK